MEHIPQDHPRAESLRIRQKVISGLHQNMVVEAGLIAHGRGEAFDYLIGEKSNENSINSMKTAV
jgi:4-phosphopantoate--beta-alanine ligase